MSNYLHRLPRWTSAVAAISFLAACADEPTSLLGPATEAATSTSAADVASAGLNSNGVRYRNPDYKHATGRDGGANLTARALLNKNGTTDYEVTTGDFEGTAASHAITKLQIKYVTQDETVQWVANQNNIDAASKSFNYPSLTRHASLQVQGNITVPNASGKGSRTGVVTLKERINLRPDLSARLEGPAQVFTKTWVTYSAEISELNRDLGATANCVFYVNGVEAARAQAIWVAEGDAVNCPLLYKFKDAGTYTVRVAVEGVDPGDYDLSNNAASMAVTVVPPTFQLRGQAGASEDHYRSTCFGCGGYTQQDEQRDLTRAFFYGVVNQPDHALEFPASLKVTQTSGGTVRDAIDLPAFGVAVAPGQESCASAFSGKSTVTVCSNGAGETSVNVTRDGGLVTYYTRIHHRHWYQQWYSYTEEHWYSHRHCFFCARHSHSYTHTHTAWRWAYYDENHYGWRQNSTGSGGYEALGSDYTFNVHLKDSDGVTFKSDPVVIPLANYADGPWSGRRGQVDFGPN